MTSVGDNTIAAYAAELMDLEDALGVAQGDKKFFFEGAREAHGKDFVASLKQAVKIARMDADKRDHTDKISAEAERIVGIIQKGLPVVRSAPAPARVEIIEEIPEVEAAEKRAAVGASPALVGADGTMGGNHENSAEKDGASDQEPGGRQLSVSSPTATAIERGDSTPSVTQAPVTPKRFTFTDKPHRDCLDPERCGGFSNTKLCPRCQEAAQ